MIHVQTRFNQNRFAFRFLRVAACVVCLACFASHASAQIELDFTHDNGFFSGNAEATAALEAAVADINAVLNLDLGPVADIASGTSGDVNITFDFNYNYLNPSTNALVTLDNTSLVANQIRIFVGAQPLGGSTANVDVLGQGGPGGVGIAASAVTSGPAGTLQNAIFNAEAEDTHRRGSGPVVAELSGAFESGETFSFDVGLTIGTVQFDDDDSINWHFNHLTEVDPGEVDFYSVALHEILHAIGIGTTATWRSQVSGSNWLGSEVIDVHGTGSGIIAVDGDHFMEGLLSARISDGVLQELVMDPSIQVGTRKDLTQFDVAALRDLGLSTIVPDLPLLGDVNLDGAVSFLDIAPFIAILSTGSFQAEANINQDNLVDFLDISLFISLLSGG